MSSESPKQRPVRPVRGCGEKAAAHPYRLELLEQLAQGERSVEVLAQRTGLSMANASQHLQHMRRGGLVAARRDGKFVFYRLADDAVLDLVARCGAIAERNWPRSTCRAQLLRKSRCARAGVARAELMRRLRDGSVTVLDVRPADEFALGHMPGAINVPLGELSRRLSAFKLGRDRRLLPRSLLRPLLRGSGDAAGKRLQGSPAGGRRCRNGALPDFRSCREVRETRGRCTPIA